MSFNLAKEKSDDTGTKSEGGLLENVTNESGLVEEFWEATLKLEAGKMTEEPVKTQFGYHIIYKVSQKEKPSFKQLCPSYYYLRPLGCFYRNHTIKLLLIRQYILQRRESCL
mgnify:CR=1 FL=1